MAMEREAIDYRTPFDVLTEQEADPAVCGELCVAAVIRLADWAARYPESWLTGKVWLRNPGASHKQISRIIGMDRSTVSRHIRTIREVIADSSGENTAIGSEDFYSR
ncbi:MAG: helix-turn-helix domain-containing protein [Victivallaceae bacterium]|nr:helix-turn-helix domain-containing protein [Victivallaceae bacterium]